MFCLFLWVCGCCCFLGVFVCVCVYVFCLFCFLSVIVCGNVSGSYVEEYFLCVGGETCQSVCLEEWCVFLNGRVCTSEAYTAFSLCVIGYHMIEVQLVLRQALENVWTEPLGGKKVRWKCGPFEKRISLWADMTGILAGTLKCFLYF